MRPLHYGVVLVAALLAMWGPPRLRPPTVTRSLTASLNNPFDLDFFGILNVVLTGVVFAGATFLVLSGRGPSMARLRSLPASGALRWYLLYVSLALVSTLYSPSPLYTLYFAAKLAVVPVLVYWLAVQRKPHDQPIRYHFATSTVIAIVIGVLFVIAPRLVSGQNQASGVRVTGGMFSDYGRSAMDASIIALSIALYSSRARHRAVALVAMAPAWVLLAMSRTRSTIASGVIAAGILIWTAPNRSRRARWLLTLLVVVVVLVAGTLGSTLYQYATRGGQGLDTGSGRTVAFSYLWDQWLAQPLTGYGWAAGARFALVSFVDQTNIGIGAAHDGLSKVLIDLGLVGVVVIAVSIGYAWRDTIRLLRASMRTTAADRWRAVMLVVMMVLATLDGLASTGIGGGNTNYVIVVCVLPFLTARMAKTLEPAKRRSRDQPGLQATPESYAGLRE